MKRRNKLPAKRKINIDLRRGDADILQMNPQVTQKKVNQNLKAVPANPTVKLLCLKVKILNMRKDHGRSLLENIPPETNHQGRKRKLQRRSQYNLPRPLGM